MATLSLSVPIMRVKRKEDGVMGFLVGGRFIAVTAEGGKPLPQTARPRIATQLLAVKGAFDSRTCARCWPYYETVWKSDDPKRPRYPMHIRCRCKLVPVTGPGEEPSKPGAYKDYLSEHPHIARAILGKRRMEMLRFETVKMADMFDDNNRIRLIKELPKLYLWRELSDEIRREWESIAILWRKTAGKAVPENAGEALQKAWNIHRRQGELPEAVVSFIENKLPR